MPSLATKRISPHTIRRHTTATHLLRAGVDINTVRAWLGHVSLDTTNIYAEIDLEMKAKAPAKCEVADPSTTKRRWRDDPAPMAFFARFSMKLMWGPDPAVLYLRFRQWGEVRQRFRSTERYPRAECGRCGLLRWVEFELSGIAGVSAGLSGG